MQAYLKGVTPPYDADALNETMDEVQLRFREVVLAGREVTKYWTAYFFQQNREQYPDRVYPAFLLGWIRQVRATLPGAIALNLQTESRLAKSGILVASSMMKYEASKSGDSLY